jgi:2-haloacid dehalogenase
VSEPEVRALVFDVFGTVVDWRSSIVREGRALGARLGIEVDWEAFADAWRARYQPSMERVRSGERPCTRLDDLHRESLLELLREFRIPSLDERDVDDFNRAWHRLDPWPDCVPGLTRLRRRYALATLSNGNVALLMNMARRAGLPWDAILGAEPARAYKPMPEAYLRTAGFLGLPVHQVMLVAAHNDDLVAASSHGMRTAFVARPTEYGPRQVRDLSPEHDFDFVASSMEELAGQLGC